MQANLRYIGRDGLAAVLGVLGERSTRAEGVRVLDIRRHDERALYGSIPGEGPSATVSASVHAGFAISPDSSRPQEAAIPLQPDPPVARVTHCMQPQ